MNLETYHKWLEDPHRLDASSLPLLEELTREFPYCQATQILYLLNLKKEKDYRYNKQLRVAAAYAPDRARLRRLVRQMESVPPEEKPADTSGKPVAVEEKAREEEKKIEELEMMIQESLSEIEEKRNRLRLLIEEKRNALADRKGLKEADAGEDLARPLPKDELLEDFLRQQGTSSEKRTFFNPVEKARKSLEDDESVTSETLARLLASQGKYQKAIKIYHQLLLNNPEKSSYFAARIENLKKKIKE
jgi:tetratricopeptide (TPR) repeat protein